ncbi:hypothetical protein [Metabacillus sp. cB07]|uniref:hypothetical protein n=1 Tax=Metabacillus sp. cB07 TaxID=2806989 RepID=UPI001939940A|nr:hypothetical protein [Metabacillus sp. cB07]
MTKRSKQIYDELLYEYADENLRVKIDNELFKDLKINKPSFTRMSKKWVESDIAKWVDTSTIQLIIKESDAPEDIAIEEEDPFSKNREVNLDNTENSSSAQVPNYLLVFVSEMIERKLNTKLSKELNLYLRKKIVSFDDWENAVKNILISDIPEEQLKLYLDSLLNKVAF